MDKPETTLTENILSVLRDVVERDEDYSGWVSLCRDAAEEIERLRSALAEVERMANEGRDDAIDNRGLEIDLEEATQFEDIAAFARAVLAA